MQYDQNGRIVRRWGHGSWARSVDLTLAIPGINIQVRLDWSYIGDVETIKKSGLCVDRRQAPRDTRCGAVTERIRYSGGVWHFRSPAGEGAAAAGKAWIGDG